ncbi:type 2A phosphatase-associated protein 42 [Hypoxylon fragiforme]|uniref:type 2A phosphatase-associated protein 42 n=1 Tax=Hypoxylon fragiforme TaxID=63214 RepID=UPI0020C70E09|nr:type 2A phosphatase-associated protein 42 [Hypoxylon fragiforme]KAI2607258.1 type 2A phosphatase-associated protein 42 [Hypoxylon fragiforme]
MSEEPKTLKAVFQAAELKRTALERTYESNSPTYHEDLSQALELYQQCIQIINKVSLFSPNESLEDIATSDIPYLLVNYHIAELLQRVSISSVLQRKAQLNTTRNAFEKFLHLLDNYSMLSQSDKKLFIRYNEDPDNFSTISATDPAARRNAKISDFKAAKEMKNKLEYMRNSPRYLEDGGDEEAVRELYLTNITFCTYLAFQALDGISREMQILAQAPIPLTSQASAVHEDDERRRRESHNNDGYSDRLDQPLNSLTTKGPLLSKEGKPLRPFTLTSNRQEIQKGVFRPGHNLPTMSIDEYLDEERRRGNIIEGGGEASGRQPEPDEDNFDKADAETMKAREWDEFKEANPRGSGNTLNRG